MTDFEAQLIDAIPDLRRASRALTGSRDMADDLVQATLERALLKQDLYEPTGAFVGWLTMIMRRLFIDDFRKKRPVLVDNAEELSDRGGQTTRPNQVETCLLNELKPLIAELSPEARAVLKTIAIDGTSYEQAAERFGVPLGTIRSRLFRAREALAEKLGLEEGDRPAI